MKNLTEPWTSCSCTWDKAVNFPTSFRTPEKNVFFYFTKLKEKSQTKEGEKGKEETVHKDSTRKFFVQPQTQEAAESTLCEGLESFGARGHDKKFQCMSAWSRDQKPAG